jgi:hypothetical protein
MSLDQGRRVRTAAFSLLPALLIACGSDSPSQPRDRSPAALAIEGGNGQTAVVATSTGTRPTVRVTDESGAGVANIRVTFTVTAGNGWVTDATVTSDAAGHAATTWYLGPAPATTHTLRVSAAGFSADFSATATPLVAGVRYTGVNSYVEFIAGDMAVIISAPHGGTLQPSSIPERSAAGATVIRDASTDDLALAMRSAFESSTGGTPHIAVMHLHRSKVDANREIGEAAEGNRAAEHAWREYHGFIEAARHHVATQYDRGFYIDLHGHGHDVQRLELGYLLTPAQLAGDDASLNDASIVQRSSIRELAESSTTTHAELLRGPGSLGSMLEAQGYPAVPSSTQPHPGVDPYFTGGYSTARHGSRDGGTIDAVQIEAHRVGVRDTDANRHAFAAALALVVESWFDMHYGTALAR